MSYKILIVDDTNFMRKMLADCLRQSGHVVVGEATNGREAIKLYEELQPDIVMMDLTMPEMNGIDAIKEIRMNDPDAIVLICSAMHQQGMIFDALEAGAKGYVMKPFKPERVDEIIQKYAAPFLVKSDDTVEKSFESQEAAGNGAEDWLDHNDSEEQTLISETNDVNELNIPYEEVAAAIETSEEQEAAAIETSEEEEAAIETSEEQETSDDEKRVWEQFSTSETITQEVVMEQEAESFVQSEPFKQNEEEETTLAVESAKHLEGTNLVRGNGRMKSFVSSYMCNWQEEINGESTYFMAICTENENRILVEMTNANKEKQFIQFSLDGFRQLTSWLEEKIEVISTT